MTWAEVVLGIFVLGLMLIGFSLFICIILEVWMEIADLIREIRSKR